MLLLHFWPVIAVLQLGESQSILLSTSTPSNGQLPSQSVIVSGGSRPPSPTPLKWSYVWQGGSDMSQPKPSDLGAIPASGAPDTQAGTTPSTPRSDVSSISVAVMGDTSPITSITVASLSTRPSGQFAPTRSSSALLGTRQLPAPGHNRGIIESSSTSREPNVLFPSSSTITPLADFMLLPSGIRIDPSSTTASSEGVIFGGLLFALSESIQGVDLTVPTNKAEILHEVDNTIVKAENLFGDLGGIDSTGSCNGGSKARRLANPFTSLVNLAGNILNIIGCADEILKSLKDNLDKDTPNPNLTDELLGDLGTLAGETDPANKSGKNSLQNSGTSERSSPSSTAPSSTSSSSTSSNSGTGCAGCCPTDVFELPTTGTPAIIPAPTDDYALKKRAMPGRFHHLAKRKPARPIESINKCKLRTPIDWQVATPTYPGGFEFYTSETQGQLGGLTTISRYYRSTNVGAPACTPTITRLNAKEWTYEQSGNVPGNDVITVDHAYENTFLTGFMQTIIDRLDGVTCNDANKMFFDTEGCVDNRLEPIFSSLASLRNPDFIAMSQWLNGDAKAYVLGPTFDPQLGGSFKPESKVKKGDNWSKAVEKIEHKLRLAQVLVGAAQIINADDTIARMQRTNNRIYVAFQTLDTYLSQHPDLPKSNFGWATRYKRYMDNYINYRNGATTSILPSLLVNIGADLVFANNNVRGKVQSDWDQWNNLYNSLKTYYGQGGAGANDLAWSINWEWNTNNVKREELDNTIAKRQACSQSTSSTITTSDIGSSSITTHPATTIAPPSTTQGFNASFDCMPIRSTDLWQLQMGGGCRGVDYCRCKHFGGVVKVSASTTTSVITGTLSASSSGGSPITTMWTVTRPDCGYITTQPTANDCPVDSQLLSISQIDASFASVSLVSLTSASLASVSSASKVNAAQPTASGQCFPYHDVNDLKILAPDVNSACAGTNPTWGMASALEPGSAADSNVVHTGYTLDANAPPECQDLYKDGHSDYVTLLCSAPLNQLVNDCPYNGGSISNVCGQWWIQTCPLEEKCQVGCPGGGFDVGDKRCGKTWPPPPGG